MAATLLRRALQLRRVLPSPSSTRFLSTANSIQQNTTAIPIDLSCDQSRRRLVNSLVYRSKQRGFLELDLVTNCTERSGASSHGHQGIRSFLYIICQKVGPNYRTCFILQENPDLWKWLTGQEQPPEAVNSNPVLVAIKSKVTDNLSKHSSPETRSAPGQPWVRGWDDKRGLDGPKYGNQ
ncbi:unnamed protein product [Alopecurus aequalis]